jgi:hypothetical protein
MYDQGRNADVMLTILSLVLLCLRSCFSEGTWLIDGMIW